MKTSIPFLTAMFSLIAFAAFLSSFPHGIDIATQHSIECQNCNISFYGGMKGNGSIELYSKNSTIVLNNKTINASYIAFKGAAHFYFPSLIYSNGKAYFHDAKIEGTGIMSIDNKKRVGKFSFNLCGNSVANISISNSLFIKGENLANFLRNFPENISLVKTLNLLPIAIDNVFYLKGNENIDSMNGNGSLIFRGEGELNKGELKAKSYLIIKNKMFFENENKMKIAAFYIPYKIIYIWIAAIVAFIISLFIKRELEFDKKFSSVAPILSLLFIAITAYIWEKQAEIIFGIGIPSAINLQSILTLIFIVVPYMEIIALIEFPLRISISSIFSIFGFHHIGKAIAISIAYPAAIWLGIKLLPAILNMIFAPLLGLL